jgi:hypothetical protein
MDTCRVLFFRKLVALKLHIMKLSFKILNAVLLTGSLAFVACNKDTSCKANITCKDQNGAPVKGADVLLYANIKPNVDGDVKAHGVTDESGKVSFIFKLPAIFDVKASVNTKTVQGMVKLEEGKSTDATLTMQ